MKQPSLENISQLLPASALDIARHFPGSSSRGIRNKLNSWVNEGKLFTTKKKTSRGRPIIEYTLEKPKLMDTNIKTEENFEGFVILETIGHCKLGGYIKEATIAGSSFIRIDTFNEAGVVTATQFYNPNSVYCITPTTKEIAIAFGLRNQPAPVQLLCTSKTATNR